MTAFVSSRSRLSRWIDPVSRPLAVFAKDAGHGLLEVCHNSLALIGLALVAIALCFATRADLRHQVEQQALAWLQTRQEARTPVTESDALAADLGEHGAVTRATAVNPSDLNRQQAAVAWWLSRRYRVAPEPVARLVQEAWSTGQRAKLDPTLILAIMAVESSFNPFAQSTVGAQGLMQVMTRVHDDKYVAFGGNHAAFDPVSNLRVGVQVLKECISRAGSLEGGLRYYVGAAMSADDGGYASKVLAEQTYLKSVAGGQRVSTTAPLPVQQPAPAATPVNSGPEPEVPVAEDAHAHAEQPVTHQRIALR